MILCYVAGPFTASDLDVVEANVLAAENVARTVIRGSGVVACLVPHSIGRMFASGPGSPEYWYAATLEMANRCDCAIMVPGWEKSTGSKREKAMFEEQSKPVFLTVAELIEWAVMQ